MKRKFKNKDGSTFIFALFLLTLVGIIATVLYSYVVVQTKVSMNTEDNIQDMYIAQGGIERAVGKFISTIDIDPPTDETVETETPNYIAPGTVTRRVGRSVRALVDEIGIINGNFDHKSKFDTQEEHRTSEWLDKDIGKILNRTMESNKGEGILNDLQEFNTITWYVDSEQSKGNDGKWVKNKSDLVESIAYLESIKGTIEDLEDRVLEIEEDEYSETKLNKNQIDHIKKNINIINQLISKIESVIDKSDRTNVYFDYEYFITHSNTHASTLDETIDSILINDMESLKKLIEVSIKSINAMPKLITNLNQIEGWTAFNKMNSTLSSNKQAILDGIELDLKRAKSNDYSKEEKMKWIVSASIKLNKLIVMIGEVNTDKVITEIANKHNVNSNYDNGLTDNKSGFTRTTILNARVSTKAAQIECDYIQYKLGKAILNLYKDDTSGILQYAYENLNEIEIISKIHGKHIKSKLPTSVFNKLDNVKVNLERLNEMDEYKDKNPYTLEAYDDIVDLIITSAKESPQDLSLLIEELEEISNNIINSNNEDYNSTNASAEVKINNAINNLKNIEVILNNLVLDNDYITTSFSSISNVKVNFENNLNISESINGSNGEVTSKILGTTLESINAKTKQSGSEGEGIEVSPSDIEKGSISLNPNRSLEFELVFDSSVTESKRSRLKVDAKVYIENIRVIKNTENKPISVKYNINYSIKGISEIGVKNYEDKG